MMRALRPLWRELALFYFSRAMREIHKLHPDVPYITHRIRDLTAERHQGAK